MTIAHLIPLRLFFLFLVEIIAEYHLRLMPHRSILHSNIPIYLKKSFGISIAINRAWVATKLNIIYFCIKYLLISWREKNLSLDCSILKKMQQIV